jgi:hypothetical protein
MTEVANAFGPKFNPETESLKLVVASLKFNQTEGLLTLNAPPNVFCGFTACAPACKLSRASAITIHIFFITGSFRTPT